MKKRVARRSGLRADWAWLIFLALIATGGRAVATQLSEAKVTVRAVPGKPGSYEAVAYLRPHFQLETLSTSMRLVAEVPKKS